MRLSQAIFSCCAGSYPTSNPQLFSAGLNVPVHALNLSEALVLCTVCHSALLDSEGAQQGITILSCDNIIISIQKQKIKKIGITINSAQQYPVQSDPQNHALGLLRRGISVGVVPRRSSPTSEDPLSAIGKQSVTAVITHLAPPQARYGRHGVWVIRFTGQCSRASYLNMSRIIKFNP